MSTAARMTCPRCGGAGIVDTSPPGVEHTEAVAAVLNPRITASLPLADWAVEPPHGGSYSLVNPDWLAAIIAEARAVRAVLATDNEGAT